MNDFVLKKRDLDRVQNLLMEEAPAFAKSEEFKALDEQDRMVTGLVCAAFTKYFVRLHQAVSRPDASESERAALEQCYAAIERLAASTDPTVNNLVVVEVFENVSGPETLLPEIEKRLKPKSLALYKRWIA